MMPATVNVPPTIAQTWKGLDHWIFMHDLIDRGGLSKDKLSKLVLLKYRLGPSCSMFGEKAMLGGVLLTVVRKW